MDPSAIISALQVPSYDSDRRVRDVLPGQKRGLTSAQDVADSLLTTAMGKRFRGGEALGPLRSAVPDQLARSMTVVNSGISTVDSQTDEIITQLVMVKPFPQRWEQGYVEKTTLFASRSEEMFGLPNVHTVADVPVMNFLLELGSLAKRQYAFAPRGNMVSELADMFTRFKDLIADSGEDWAAKWNLLGPMTTFQDAGIHSSYEPARRAQGAERMLGYSVYNRALTFNLFAPELQRGQQLFYVCKDVDMSDSPNFLDPHGNAVVARTAYPAFVPQVVGFTDKQAAFPFHNTSYRSDEFTDPREGDLDYVRREHRLRQEYCEYEVDDETGRVHMRDCAADDKEIVPQIVYDAYMIGSVKRLGLARYTEGRAPTEAEIRRAHRSQERMKLLQTVEIYRGL